MSETVPCPVCRWPAGDAARCDACAWELTSGFLLGEATEEDVRDFGARLHEAQCRLDTTAAVLAAGGDAALLRRLESLVRAGPLPPAERDRLARELADGPADGFPVEPGTVLVEIGADGVSGPAGPGRGSAELAVWPWPALLPQLPDDPAERRFGLAGGVGRDEPDRAAQLDRLAAALPDRLPVAGPVALVCHTPGWAWPERAMDILARRHPEAALLRPADPGAGAGSAMVRCPDGITAFAAGSGSRMLTGGPDGWVSVWEPGGTGPRMPTRGPDGSVWDPGGTGPRMPTREPDGSVWDPGGTGPRMPTREPDRSVWDPGGTGPRMPTREPDGSVWDPGGTGPRMPTRGPDGSVWDPGEAGPVERRRPHAGRVTALAAADDVVVSGGQDGSVRLWIVGAGEPRPAAGHSGWVNAVGVTAEAAYSLGDDGQLRRTPLGSGTPYALGVGFSAATSLAVSRDDGLLAYGGTNGLLTVLTAATAEQVAQWRLPAAVTALAFDPVGRLLVAGAADGTARIYSLAGQALRGELPGHQGPVRGVAIDQHGTAVTGDDDGTVRRWLLRAGRPAGDGSTLGAHREALRGVAVASDGRPVSAGAEGLVRFWGGASAYRPHRDRGTR
jgi:WD40 repeat protein